MRLALWLLFVGAFAALNLYGRSQGPRPDNDIIYQYDFALGSLAGYAVLLSLVLALTTGLPRREVLALRRPRSWVRALGLALGAVLVIYGGVYLTLRLAGAGDEQNLAPAGWDSSRAAAYALSFFAVVVVAPIVEELLYRGVGLSLLERAGAPVAVVVTAVLFGLGHGLVLSLAAFVWFGIVIALVRLRTNSIYPAFIVHCVFNAIGMTAPLFL
ncbi:MAG: type II CAAX endopeptidase family protein [Gaiellaceae bacterium]